MKNFTYYLNEDFTGSPYISEIEVWLQFQDIGEEDKVIDFKAIKSLMKKLDMMDIHNFVENPTLESITLHVIDEMQKIVTGADNIRIKVWMDNSDRYLEINEEGRL